MEENKQDNYFKFKQFTVWQRHAAMKVCTDACIFGAWIDPAHEHEHVLDVGTGTGLLTLMLAQRSHPGAQFTAVEINMAACLDAALNFKHSAWKHQIQLINANFLEYAAQTRQTFDKVIINPPFYQQSLRGAHAQRNLAMHESQLNMESLLVATERLTHAHSTLYVMYPPYEAELFLTLAASYQWHIAKTLHVRHHPEKKIIRVLMCLTKSEALPQEQILSIKNEDNATYSHAFSQLLAPYYLAL